VDGLTTKDSAGRIGKSDVAVRVMLSRTVQKLQQRLGK
jgi:DNA-directed RNA polymerase specialized sigma24 family protein